MATIVEVEMLALVLPDEDDGFAEALMRDAEIDANPSMGISLEELDQKIGCRRN